MEAHFTAQAAHYGTLRDGWPVSAILAAETRALREALSEAPVGDAVDLGCGAGHHTRLLLRCGATSVLAVDRVPAMVAQAVHAGAQGWTGDAARVPYPRPFDTLLSAGLLEFVDDPDAVVAHATTAASPRSRLVLLVPRPSLGGRLYQAMHALRGLRARTFDGATLDALLTRHGWRVTGRVAAGPLAWVTVGTRG